MAKQSKFSKGEEVLTKTGIALILDVWYADTNLFHDYEYKCFTPNGVEYFREKDIVKNVTHYMPKN